MSQMHDKEKVLQIVGRYLTFHCFSVLQVNISSVLIPVKTTGVIWLQ